MLEKVTMGERLWLCMYVTTWAAIRYSTIALILVDIKSSDTQRYFDYGLLLDPWRTDVHHVCFQYFEYTSHKELRHNIGKQLCLHASPYPEPVKIELCTLKGKGSSLTPQQEWVFTEVSVLSEQNCSFLVFAVSISYQILRPSPFNYCLLQYFLAGELDQTLMMSCLQKYVVF